jgi:hypothetical protein
VSRLLIFLLLSVVLTACGESLTVEQQVINTIRQMEEKIEAGHRIAFMEHIAEDFSAQNGGMNRDQVRALVVFQLKRFEKLEGRLFPISVSDTGDGAAEARFRALVTGGPGWIPDSGQVYDFETWWRLENGDWLLVAANWDPVPLGEVIDNLPMPDGDR